MPTYEYLCKACGHLFEEIQKISEPPIEECPNCHEKTAKRQISQGNFILKGGGWYTTGGYGTKGTKSEDSSSSSSSSSSTPASPAPEKKESSSEKKESSGGDSGGSTKSVAA